MREVHSQSIEDYLKTIYTLADAFGRATTTQLAERLGVTPASVTGMVQKLAEAEPPLLVYHKHHGVMLTPEGEKAALKVIRQHRLLELFLIRTLGYSWDEVHEEADRLEHVISQEMEDRIAEALGEPSHDPHGEPIPSRDLELPPSSDTRLKDLRPGQCGEIERVDAPDAEFLRYLSSIGLLPNTRVVVVEYSPYDGNLSLRVVGSDKTIVLGPRVTEQIYIKVIQPG